MPFREVKVGSPQVRALYDRFLKRVEEQLDDPELDKNVMCRDLLTEIHVGGGRGWQEIIDDESLPLAERVKVGCFDPRNVSIEPEYYFDCDAARFGQTKPLIWLWMMFDRSPIARNMHLGIPFRRLLAKRIFKKCGKNVKIFHDVEVSYGYNLEAGDDCVVHRGVLLDDRGGISMGNKVSVSDWANVYSHTHDVHDIEDISMLPTRLGHGARITYHSTVLAGVTVGDDGMVGAMALATKDVEPHHVKGGIPAKTIKIKDRKARPGGMADGCC